MYYFCCISDNNKIYKILIYYFDSLKINSQNSPLQIHAMN